MLLHFHCWRSVHSAWPLMGGKEYKEACPWIPPDFTSVFSLYNPVLNVYYITVVNLSCKHNYMLIPVSSLVNIWMQNWSWGPLTLLSWCSFSHTPLLISPALSHLKSQGFTVFSSLCFLDDLIWSLNIKYNLYSDNFQIYISSLVLTTNSRNW